MLSILSYISFYSSSVRVLVPSAQGTGNNLQENVQQKIMLWKLELAEQCPAKAKITQS